MKTHIIPGRPGGGRHLRRAVVAVLALSGLLLGAAGTASADAPTDDGPTAAEFGAAWLAVEVDGGLPLVNFGSPDWGATLDAGLAFAGSGVGASRAGSIWTALVAERDTVVSPFGSDSPGRLAKMVLFANALGEDPRTVGEAPGEDLVVRLAATLQLDGPDAGLFGTDDATYDGAFRQGMAMVALQGAGAAVDPSAASWLEAQQCADGSWMPYRSDLSAQCAFDAARFVGPDSNSVAVAVAGLAASAPDSPAIATALGWLDSQQNADGGWSFFPGDGSDPNSTALVMQALIAVGELDAPRFADQEGTPLAALLSFQLGCDAPAADRGAFTYPFSNDAPSLLATTQALPAAAGVPLDHVADGLAGEPTALDCEPAVTPTTVAPSTSAPATTAPPTTEVPAAAIPDDTVPTTLQQVDPLRSGVLDATASAPSSSSPTGAPASTLALTGASSVQLMLFGSALLAAGVALLARSRRRVATTR